MSKRVCVYIKGSGTFSAIPAVSACINSDTCEHLIQRCHLHAQPPVSMRKNTGATSVRRRSTRTSAKKSGPGAETTTPPQRTRKYRWTRPWRCAQICHCDDAISTTSSEGSRPFVSPPCSAISPAPSDLSPNWWRSSFCVMSCSFGKSSQKKQRRPSWLRSQPTKTRFSSSPISPLCSAVFCRYSVLWCSAVFCT